MYLDHLLRLSRAACPPTTFLQTATYSKHLQIALFLWYWSFRIIYKLRTIMLSSINSDRPNSHAFA